jgi:type IV pilus assembly protein PilN
VLARKRVIEALQANRTETVHLFNELAKQVPEGIYLRTLTQAGNRLLNRRTPSRTRESPR